MNSENRAKLRKIIQKMRTARVTGTPESMSPLFGTGVMASGLDKIAKMMQEYSSQNRIEGMSDPDTFNKALAGAQLGMRLGGLGGAALMQKFVNDHYQYTVHPAIRSIGKAGGKYGHILEEYIQAKSDIRKSYGDMGAQIGQGLAFGLGFLAKGLRLASLGAAATGIGIPAAAVGLIASFAVEAAASMVLPWVGRKVAETIVDKTGYAEENALPTLGQGILSTMPEGIQHFRSVSSSVVGQTWYKENESYGSYFRTMERISKTKKEGVSLNDLSISARDTGALYDAIGKTLDVNNKYRGDYTRTLGIFKGITGEDVMDTFAGISQGSAKSKTTFSSGEIDATADAFQVFFNAVSKGGSTVNKSAINLTKSLAAAADTYSKKNFSVDNVDTLFAGVQTFVQKNMQVEGKQDTNEASSIIDILNSVAKSSHDSALATQISNYAGLPMAKAKRGLDEDGFTRMSKAFSNMYDFGGDSSVENGVMKLGRKGENAFAQLYLDATKSQEEGGLGLGEDGATELIKYVLTYQTNSKDLKFGGRIKNPLADVQKAVQMEALLVHGKTQTDITNHYEKLTGLFVDEFNSLGNNILRFSAQVTEDIATGALNLLVAAKEITENGTTLSTIDAASTPGSPQVLGYSTPTMTAGTKYIEGKNILVAQAGFKEEIAGAAAKAGLSNRTLYAFFGAESRFGNVTENYANKPYVGVGQVGAEAQAHMNRVHGTNLDRFNRQENILLAAYYADYLRDRYVKLKEGSFKNYNFDPSDPRVIYMAYNWGMGNLDNHIRKYGGINWDALPAETRTGVANVEKALRGYDAVQGAAIQGPALPPGVVIPTGVKGQLVTVVNNYRGGVIQGINANSRRTTKAQLYTMSGASTTIGMRTADAAERLLASGGSIMTGANANPAKLAAFYGWCAAVAGWAVDQGGFNNRASGDANDQLAQWMRKGAVLTMDEVAQTGGFQPGDLVYVINGQHVGIVSYDGSIIQAGFGVDKEKGTSLIRTDSTTFNYAGGAIVVRPGADADDNGVITQAERNAMFMAMTKLPNPKKSEESMQKVKKSVIGKEAIVNAIFDKTSGGTFTVKNSRGAGLSKAQVAKIKKQEAAIEKQLGLKADQLSIGTKNSNGGTFLDIKINVPLDDVGKVTQDILRIIERII